MSDGRFTQFLFQKWKLNNVAIIGPILLTGKITFNGDYNNKNEILNMQIIIKDAVLTIMS